MLKYWRGYLILKNQKIEENYKNRKIKKLTNKKIKKFKSQKIKNKKIEKLKN